MWPRQSLSALLPGENETVAEVAMILCIMKAGSISHRQDLMARKCLHDAHSAIVTNHRVGEGTQQVDPRVRPAVAKQVADDDPSAGHARHLRQRLHDLVIFQMVEEKRTDGVVERIIRKGKQQRVAADNAERLLAARTGSGGPSCGGVKIDPDDTHFSTMMLRPSSDRARHVAGAGGNIQNRYRLFRGPTGAESAQVFRESSACSPEAG